VNFIRNITDIDDKIIKKAGELKKDWQTVVQENITAYEDDLKMLGIEKESLEPRATDNIDLMIKHIEGLIQKEYAYESDGDVYFSVRKFKKYGKLSKQSIEQMLEGVRIEKDEKKKDPLDFALWKKSKEGEPFWPSPWGEGRPGWHIECSVMSMKHLNCQTLDIHAGGRDLIFPHHENEVAQSEALTGKSFAKYWIHHGLLTINGQKMAKSLGNFITVQEAVKKYGADNLKMLFLSSHYSSPVDFSEQKMEEAKKALDRFDILFWKASEIIKEKNVPGKAEDFIESHKDDFIKAMDDDFNTPKALAALFNLVNDTNRFIDDRKEDADYEGIIVCAVDTLAELTKNVFGFFKNDVAREPTPEEEGLLEDRSKARADKDFKRSDEIRELLKEKGIVVEDSKDGQTWRWA